MNPFLGLFDRQLHTVEYVRTTSSLLFTAILAVATRYRHQDVYHVCLKQAQDHIGSLITLQKRASWLPIIQAICTLAFWKDPESEAGWRNVGFAIRLAYEEGLHRLPTGAGSTIIETDDRKARILLSQQRTWLCKWIRMLVDKSIRTDIVYSDLCCMDQM